tara:strand:- start:3025 stop:4107 length:1083 start_codon:yes stop_codon:yes gene_type:complete
MLLSLAIPTKNRYQTLIPVLKYLILNSSYDIEFVVHDNSDNNSLIKKVLSDLNDSRIKYFYSKKEMSQSENSNQAVSKCTGEYICFIGDDDFVLPSIIDFTWKMKKKGIEIVKFIKPVFYWPNTLSSKGILQTQKIDYSLTKKSSKKIFSKMLNNCATDMDYAPSLYHGIVRKNILNKIKKKYGTYFPGPSPDMANCIAILLNSKSFTIANYPVVVSGNSSASMAGLGIKGEHYGEIHLKKHLGKIKISDWSKHIPFYWSGPTIWAQSMFSVLNIGDKDYLSDINYNYLYALLFIYHFRNFNVFFKKTYRPKITFYFIVLVIFMFFKRLNNFVKKIFLKNYSYHYNLDIDLASNILMNKY